MRTSTNQIGWWAVLCLLLMTAFFLRTWKLLDVPPGLTHDEASNQHDASAILDGQHALYFPSGYGHEPLYTYSVAIFTWFFGEGIFTLRITSVFWSLLTWAVTVSLARRWWGFPAACVTGTVMTVSFWALMMARVGLRAPVLPALFSLSIWFYDRAVHNPRGPYRGFSLAGLFLGASFYTYMASRGLPLVFLFFPLFQLISNKSLFHKIWKGSLLTIGIALLIGAPLFIYLRLNPELELRVSQLGGAMASFWQGDWRPLLKNITDSLPLMLSRGDPRWLYNIGGRAALEPALALLFGCGVVAALLNLRQPRSSLMLLWLGGGVAPALLTSVEYNTLHAIAAMPVAVLLATLGLQGILDVAQQLQRGGKTSGVSVRNTAFVVAFVLAMAATGTDTFQAYFQVWASNRDVRVAYHHHVVALANELSRSPDRTTAVITSLYPGEVHDPYTMNVALKDLSLPLRWVDGRNAVFVPRSPSRLFIEEQTMFPPSLWNIIKPFANQTGTLAFRPEDIPRQIRAYAWESDASWHKVTAHCSTDFYRTSMEGGQLASLVSYDAPIHFGNVSVLHCTQWVESEDATPPSIQLLTVWSVEQPVSEELNIFVHLLDQNGDILSQQDHLAAPSWQWTPGDRLIHLHILPLSDDAARDPVAIAIGMVRQADGTRLSIPHLESDLDRILIPVPDGQ